MKSMEEEGLILIKERLKVFREKIEKEDKEIEGFLVTNLKNLNYLSGFDGEGFALIGTNGKNYLLTDLRYTEQAQKESPDFKILTDEPNKKNARILALKKVLAQSKIKKIAFESNNLSYADFKKYSDSFESIEFLPTENIIEQLRMIKDKEEIIKIKKAAQITTESLKDVFEIIKPGMRELDIASELAYTMRKKGAQKEAFNIIVVSGERSSLVHGKPSEKKIDEGELIIIDVGANYQNYNSDITRTIIMGKENAKQKGIFSIVLEAQNKALEFLKPGVSCKEVDSTARDIIVKKGYGEYFCHGLGHGVGLDIHELPRVSFSDDTVLLPGMVVTIEPGIYLPEVGGVRIEDSVLITEAGYEILTWFPKILNL
ncbi:MAG: Xaa-Pro peptidase family protein [Candidatus Atribacteria bacterium]|nr:Xaa-Pro peptidase family protein [bacterium]MCG2762674.1 Xaa-Pro peptidase family protein [Candidatus Atribacteria bacterium]MCG2820777.1 Xaa-Pro peptidase family protein [Candidatus Atribacteria bacterium]